MKKGVDYPGVTVCFLCHDGAGNFFLAKRGTNCRDEHGCWDGGSGGLELGDTIEDTLKKEIKEEYGTEVLEYEFLGYQDIFRTHNDTKTHWVALNFLVRIDREAAYNAEPHKFDEVGWFTLDALPSPLHSQFPKFTEMYREKIAKSQNNTN